MTPELASLGSLETFLTIYLKAGREARIDYLAGASALASFLGTSPGTLEVAANATHPIPSLLISYEVQELAKAVLEAEVPRYNQLLSLEERLARLKLIEQEVFKTVIQIDPSPSS